MRSPEILRLRPGGEGILVLPGRVRNEERIALFRHAFAPQKMKRDEARHFGKARIAPFPYGFESLFLADGDTKTVHCEEHGLPLMRCLSCEPHRSRLSGRPE
ncbi:hypothetical protein D3C72_2177810 [compost metagenome]